MSARSYLVDVAQGRRRIRVFEAGGGRPLVFLHGAGGVTEDSPFLAALARRWRVFAPLLPGYGDSEGAEDLSNMLAVTLHSFDVVDALGLDRPILVGHSMGGMIAAEMASVLPHELPAFLFDDPEFGERMLTAGADLDDPKFLEAFIIRNARQLAMAGKLLFPIPDRGLAERLYRIRARTMLVWGEGDRVIPPAHGDAFCGGIAGAELIRIPEAGHMVIIEQPEAVVAALARLG